MRREFFLQMEDALREVHRRGIELREPRYLVPEDRFDVKPTYYLHAGMLFVPLTRDYLKTWGGEAGVRFRPTLAGPPRQGANNCLNQNRCDPSPSQVFGEWLASPAIGLPSPRFDPLQPWALPGKAKGVAL